MEYPVAVFIDTNIWISCKFNLTDNSVFSILERYIRDNKIHLYVSNICIREVEAHIESAVSATFAEYNKALKFAKKQIALAMLSETAMSKYLSLPEKKSIEDELVSKFHEYLSRCNVTELTSEGINLDEVMDDYFEQLPPFEAREIKKSEFPDAFMIQQIKHTFVDKNVAVVTGDEGFRKSFYGCSNICCFDNLHKLLDMINQDSPIYAEVVQTLRTDEMRMKIQRLIQDYLLNEEIEVEGRDFDRKGMFTGPEYDETYVTDVEDIQFEFDTISDISPQTVHVSLNCEATIEVDCHYDDYDKGIWDPEDRKYVYLPHVQIEEIHMPFFGCGVELTKTVENGTDSFEISLLGVDIVLDEDSRIERKSVEKDNC